MYVLTLKTGSFCIFALHHYYSIKTCRLLAHHRHGLDSIRLFSIIVERCWGEFEAVEDIKMVEWHVGKGVRVRELS